MGNLTVSHYSLNKNGLYHCDIFILNTLCIWHIVSKPHGFFSFFKIEPWAWHAEKHIYCTLHNAHCTLKTATCTLLTAHCPTVLSNRFHKSSNPPPVFCLSPQICIFKDKMFSVWGWGRCPVQYRELYWATHIFTQM